MYFLPLLYYETSLYRRELGLGYIALQEISANLGFEEHGLGSSYQINKLAQMQLDCNTSNFWLKLE